MFDNKEMSYDKHHKSWKVKHRICSVQVRYVCSRKCLDIGPLLTGNIRQKGQKYEEKW